MRKIRSGFSAGLFAAAAICAAVFGMTVAAQAASCGSGPPAQWNQPRVKYIYSGATYGTGYSHRYASAPRATRYSTHYSARRATYSRTSYSRGYRDGFRRW